MLLKPLAQSDIETLRVLRNRPEIRRWFFYSEEISVKEQEEWYRKYLNDETDLMYSVYLRSDPHRFIGAYAHYNYDKDNRILEAGRLMLDSGNVNERGLGMDIIGCGAKIAFDSLGVERVLAEIMSDNTRSIMAHQKGAGYKQYGYKYDENGDKIVLMELREKDYREFAREMV